MALFRLTVLAFLFVATFVSQTSYAADNVAFIEKDRFDDISARSIIASYDFSSIAAFDLNRDGIDEFILKTEIDDAPALFQVIALKDDTHIKIGEIKAMKIMVSYEDHHGVRSILAFNNPHNDFDYRVYQWHAQDAHYMLEKRVSEVEDKT